MLLLKKAKVYILSNTYTYMDKLIVQVKENKGSGQKIITIPQKSEIKPGDYVEIIKL